MSNSIRGGGPFIHPLKPGLPTESTQDGPFIHPLKPGLPTEPTQDGPFIHPLKPGLSTEDSQIQGGKTGSLLGQVATPSMETLEKNQFVSGQTTPSLLSGGETQQALPDLDTKRQHRHQGLSVFDMMVHGTSQASAPTITTSVALDAVRMGGAESIETLKDFLAQGGNPNVADAAGMTLSHWAAVRGHGEIIDLLATSGADVNQKNATGATPLHMAAQGGSPEAIQFLLDAGANINAVWPLNGHTALLEATFNNRGDAVQALLEKNPDMGALTVRGLSAVDFAAREAPRSEAARQILDTLTTHNRQLAASRPELGLVEQTRDIGGQATVVIDFSQEQKNSRLQQLLQSDGIRPEQPASPLANQLLTAAQQGNLATTQQLVEQVRTSAQQAGENPTQAASAFVNSLAGDLGARALIDASLQGHVDVVRYLLEQGANPTLPEVHPMGITGLFKAAVFGHTEVARMHLETLRNMAQEADDPSLLTRAMDQQGGANGMTPLHDAALRGRTDVVRLLLEFGANTSLENYAGQTAAAIAVNDEIRSLLIT